jgi:hypothetical protein
MKLKNVISIIVSLLTIMLGGFVLFNLAFILLALLVNGFEVFADSAGEVSREMLQLASYVAIAIAIAVAAKFLLTKEQLKHTLLASMFALLLMVVLVMIGIALYKQSDIIILLAGGVVIIPTLILLFMKKANWTYIFATVYASSLGILVMLFNIEI